MSHKRRVPLAYETALKAGLVLVLSFSTAAAFAADVFFLLDSDASVGGSITALKASEDADSVTCTVNGASKTFNKKVFAFGFNGDGLVRADKPRRKMLRDRSMSTPGFMPPMASVPTGRAVIPMDGGVGRGSQVLADVSLSRGDGVCGIAGPQTSSGCGTGREVWKGTTCQ